MSASTLAFHRGADGTLVPCDDKAPAEGAGRVYEAGGRKVIVYLKHGDILAEGELESAVEEQR